MHAARFRVLLLLTFLDSLRWWLLAALCTCLVASATMLCLQPAGWVSANRNELQRGTDEHKKHRRAGSASFYSFNGFDGWMGDANEPSAGRHHTLLKF